MYKHGLYTKEAIEERRALSALLRASRESLDAISSDEVVLIHAVALGTFFARHGVLITCSRPLCQLYLTKCIAAKIEMITMSASDQDPDHVVAMKI